MIEINGVPFTPHPDIGFKSDKERKAVEYRYNYIKAAQMIKDGTWPEVDTYRSFILNDLWFVLYFVVKPFADDAGRERVNHPFIINACNDLQNGPEDFTLDIYAREHYKTSIITIAETIKYQMGHPECCTGLFSYVAPKSKQFLFSIRAILEREKILSVCFPDVVWESPSKEAPMWSIDQGIIMKRKTNRQEPSIGAYGLTEGMPTGLHFERRVYDDITTEDISGSMDIMEKIELKYDSSQNLGKEGGHHRVTGTYYDHRDPLIYIRNKTVVDDNGETRPAYLLRLKPATNDGTINGKPVLISQKRLDELKLTKVFNFQQLLDPTPLIDQKLNPGYLSPIERKFMPNNLYRFMVIDQAGDDPSNKSKNGDSWAIAVLGVEPVVDDIGQSRVFIDDLWIAPAGESEAIDQAVRMYLKGGMIQKLGVEKVGLTTTHLHIAAALKAKGRYVNFGESNEGHNGVLLRPAGRNKKKFIEGAFAWPLNNGKWFYATDVPASYIDRLKMEMTNFPLWHDDGLNTCAYLYDLLKDYHFGRLHNNNFSRPLQMAANPI